MNLELIDPDHRFVKPDLRTPFTRPSLPAFWLVVMSLLAFPSFGQDQPKTIPDGTMGEELEVVKKDSVSANREKRWRLFPGKYSSLKLGGGYLYEYAGFSQDAAARQQMALLGTPLENTFATRDFRIVASGQIKTKRAISWKAGFMYDGVTNSWFVRETGVMVAVPEISGHIFVGRTKEGFSLNKVMNGYAGWTMERQMALDVIPILADGIKYLGYLPKQRIVMNIGVFADWLSEGQSFSTYNWQWIARVGWLPIYSPAAKTVLHIGFNYRYGETLGGNIRVRSRPETNPAPRFIDTQSFASNYSNSYGPEIYYSKGPWLFGSEIYAHAFNSATADNPVFVGGDAVASFMITGESRPYNTATGIFGFVPINRSVFKGGPGALEVLVRYSSLDLNGGTIQGGKFWRITPMVNWYLSKDVRFELAYGYGVLDRFGLQGATQFYQARLQFTLL